MSRFGIDPSRGKTSKSGIEAELRPESVTPRQLDINRIPDIFEFKNDAERQKLSMKFKEFVLFEKFYAELLKAENIEAENIEAPAGKDMNYVTTGGGVHRFEGPVEGLDVTREDVFYANPLPSIYLNEKMENGQPTPITGLDDDILSRITVYDGAAITDNDQYWTSTYSHRYMARVTGLQETDGDHTGARMVVELPIVPDEHMAIFLLSASSSSYNTFNVKFADPDTDTPGKHACWSMDTSNDTVRPDYVVPGPNGHSNAVTRRWEWIMMPLNKDDVAQYKTSNNTIKLSMTKCASGSTTTVHLGGWASCVNKWGLSTKPALFIGSYCPDGGTATANHGTHSSSYMNRIESNAFVSGIRVPIIDTDKDIIVSSVAYLAHTYYQSAMYWTITGTDQTWFPNEYVSRFSGYRDARQSNKSLLSFRVPQHIVEQNAKTHPNGWRYLEFDVWNPFDSPSYSFAYFTEQGL